MLLSKFWMHYHFFHLKSEIAIIDSMRQERCVFSYDLILFCNQSCFCQSSQRPPTHREILNGSHRLKRSPLFAIYNIGVLFLIIAFAICLYVAWSLIFGTVEPGWASLMISIWLVGGFILISLGIAGTYIGQIYTEVKQRPLYHIDEILE